MDQQKFDVLENYLRRLVEVENRNNIILNDLNNTVSNQGALIYNMAQIMNMQNQSINEIQQKLNSLLATVKDVEIRQHMSDDTLTEVNHTIATITQEIESLKYNVDNIKVYNLPDGYFK